MSGTTHYDDWHTGVEFDRETRTWKGFIKQQRWRQDAPHR